MKKIEYMAPEMEVIDLKYNQILCASDGTTEGGSSSLPDEETPGDPE